MNKIYLDKLCEFSLTTYKNYEVTNKKVDLEIFINEIKQNHSLNEKGLFIKHNFIELKILVPYIEYDQLVLINPLCFNISGNIEWFNFLNGLLTVLNNEYLHESQLIKKTIIETADKTFKKKIIIEDNLNFKIIENVCIVTNIILIMITNNNIHIFNYKNNNSKVIVLYNFEKEYYPILNWNQKYYNINSQFINYLNNNNLKINYKQDDKSNSLNTFEKKQQINTKCNKYYDNINSNVFDSLDSMSDDEDIDEHIYENNNKINDNSNDNNIINNNNILMDMDTYKELQADIDHALYISEAIDNNEINNNDSITKKKKKKDKNIFLVSKQIKKNGEDNKIIEETESSIFKKTEKIDKKDIEEISKNIKPSINLEQIQKYALKLGITIYEGSTKSGKPKNKTKTELIEQIKEFAKNCN